jgi:hypothetical protein
MILVYTAIPNTRQKVYRMYKFTPAFKSKVHYQEQIGNTTSVNHDDFHQHLEENRNENGLDKKLF